MQRASQNNAKFVKHFIKVVAIHNFKILSYKKTRKNFFVSFDAQALIRDY